MNGHLDPLTLGMYADDALSADERAVAEAHLAGCAPCGARLADLRRLDRAVRALPVPPVPKGVLVLHEASTSRRRRGLGLGRLLGWPGRAGQPADASSKHGPPVRPFRPWWAAPLAALAVAAGLVLVSMSWVCRGHGSLPACAGALRGQPVPVVGWPPPVPATAIVRRVPPGTPAPWLTPVAPARTRLAGVPAGAAATPAGGPTEPPYPGPSADRVAPGPGGPGLTAVASPAAEPAGYPGPGQAGAASPRPPFARKTEAAVAAGLATMATDGGVERLFLPATSSGR